MRRRGGQPTNQVHTNGRLQARPAQTLAEGIGQAAPPPGPQPLGLDAARDGLLFVPASYEVSRPLPFALLLHGAGGNAHHGISLLQQLADAAQIILLAPDSRRQTWDVLYGNYGPDIAYIDQALTQTFERYAIDPARVAVGGFSDGASYALSVGITNGDLFTHIIAFSPGFMAPADQIGSPQIYISHGTHDSILPIDRCSRRLVPQLQRAGYDVRYREFDGPHTVPPEFAREAVEWFRA